MENDETTDTSSEARVVSVKPVRTINIYAALGIGLLVVVAIALLTLVLYGVQVATGQVDSYSSSLSGAVLGYVIAIATVFLTLPALINSRYGWKTIVATYLFQSLLTFVILALLSFLGAPAQNSPVYPTTLDSINSGIKSN
jgi:uncharacterized membrane protein